MRVAVDVADQALLPALQERREALAQFLRPLWGEDQTHLDIDFQHDPDLERDPRDPTPEHQHSEQQQASSHAKSDRHRAASYRTQGRDGETTANPSGHHRADPDRLVDAIEPVDDESPSAARRVRPILSRFP